MVFENLSPKIRKAIKKRGFVSPTEIQKLAIPKILKGKNVLLIAPTGTGKSEGAWLPIFHKFLKQKKKRGINILHITPLRALNRDLIERIQFWAEELDIDAQVRHGDTTQHQRRKQALESPSLLVTTPETLNAILPGSRMKEHLSHVKYVVVDEIHSFAGDKRGAHLSIALERLRELAGDFQLIGLSATVGSPERVAKFLVGAEREVEVVQIPATKNMKLSVESPPITKLDKRKSNDLMASPSAVARVRRIHELANEHKSSLIFVNTRHGVELLSLRMRLYDESFPFSAHHSSLSKDSRIGAERKFKNG
ncbi:TPA: DEAD/DEAH box helicase, partial [Candidatus Bathyarchaeota archaeon]|nr:DEAD/DEAH box helicase [Candidatus Bathyarchaeota archaeon]